MRCGLFVVCLLLCAASLCDVRCDLFAVCYLLCVLCTGRCVLRVVRCSLCAVGYMMVVVCCCLLVDV